MTEVLLAIDARMAALLFLAVLGLILAVVVFFVVKSVYEQRKYASAALPTIAAPGEPSDSMVREPLSSAFSLEALDEEEPLVMADGDDNGTTLDQLPGVNLSDSFSAEPEDQEPEEGALPTLSPTFTPANNGKTPAPAALREAFAKPLDPRGSHLDARAAQELADDEEEQDFTPITASSDAFTEADEHEESTDSQSLFGAKKSISIPSLSSEEDEESSYAGKRRAAAPTPTEDAMKEDS